MDARKLVEHINTPGAVKLVVVSAYTHIVATESLLWQINFAHLVPPGSEASTAAKRQRVVDLEDLDAVQLPMMICSTSKMRS